MEHWLNDLPLPSIDKRGADSVETIHAIARRNDVESMKKLLDFDLNQKDDRDDYGYTALHMCSIYGKPQGG